MSEPIEINVPDKPTLSSVAAYKSNQSEYIAWVEIQPETFGLSELQAVRKLVKMLRSAFADAVALERSLASKHARQASMPANFGFPGE